MLLILFDMQFSLSNTWWRAIVFSTGTSLYLRVTGEMIRQIRVTTEGHRVHRSLPFLPGKKHRQTEIQHKPETGMFISICKTVNKYTQNWNLDWTSISFIFCVLNCVGSLHATCEVMVLTLESQKGPLHQVGTTLYE